MIKGINLIPEELSRYYRLRKWRRIIIFFSCVYVISLASIFMYQRYLISQKMVELKRLVVEKEVLVAKSQEYTRILQRIQDIQRREEEIKRRFAFLSEVEKKRITWSGMLKRISNDIPDGVWLRGMSTSDIEKTEGKRIRFLGSAVSNRGVAEFIFTLENSPIFGDISLAYLQKREQDSITVYDFEVHANLQRTDGIIYE